MVGPSPRNDDEKAWTFTVNRSILKRVPDTQAAFLETLTAIWRLSQEEERGATDEEWGKKLGSVVGALRPKFFSSRVLIVFVRRTGMFG